MGMSFNGKLVSLIHNDNSIYRLLLLVLAILSPALYLLDDGTLQDHLWLRLVCSGICIVTFGASFLQRRYYKICLYITLTCFIIINSGILLYENQFARVYIFSAMVVFVALTLLCTQRREFLGISLINTAALTYVYLELPVPGIAVSSIIILIAGFIAIAYIAFLIRMVYRFKLKKALGILTQVNHTLISNEQKLRDSRNQLHALINSINDIVFELDENKNCLNVWYNELLPLHFDPKIFIDNKLSDIIGAEKADPFVIATDYVLKHKKPTSFEFDSVFGADKWYIARIAPIYTRNGYYTSRISISIADITGQKKYEQALKENENLLTEAQAIAKLGNWWYDDDTKSNYWSDNLFAVLEIDNIPPDMDKFTYYMTLVHPDDHDITYNFLMDIATVATNTLEHKFITPRGNLKYLKVLRGELIFKEDGSLKRVFGVIQDITEIKLSERTAKISQSELIDAQTIAKIGNWRWDVSEEALSWSDEISHIFEVQTGSYLQKGFGRLLLKYIYPDDKYIIKLLAKSPARIANTSHEFRIITAGGNIKYVSLIVGKLITRDGNLRKIIGTLQDITKRKTAEIEYKISENKYRLVLETVKLAAVSLDPTGHIIFCNKHLADMLGYEQKEITGMNWMENFIPEEVRPLLRESFTTRSIETHFVNPVLCRNGEERIISWQNTVTFDDNGDVKETTSLGEDITDQEMATRELISAKEHAERASQFKSDFLSTMSHEIRTPMNAVIGATNLLLTEDPKPEQLEYLNTLKFSGENLLAIINDILDYNKIEAGKFELHKAPFDIHQLAQKIWQSFNLKASEKHLQLDLITDTTIPDTLKGDQPRLSQILNNLISNAIKFTPQGRVIIRMDKEEATDHTVTIKFSVTDTGIGISPDYLSRVFDPFTQETHLSNYYGGTGLGLAITKRLIELHGSSIEVNSQQGVGTHFSFVVTFEISQKGQQIASHETGNTAITDLTGKHILVVDDNKMNLLVASKFLKRWHASVDEALNGQIAVDMALAKNYDLIIMDLQMPVMDGFEATQIIKKTHPNVPVIALTADAMPDTHNKAFYAGMSDYLTKPFLAEALFEKVAKHLLHQKGIEKPAE
ncbi:hypothetical protein GCM10023149_52920 [Mucilaginibacter gynuensis]|uniref:histidine kinase n=1 Tax=Mucilaginibacter gynuensis TaxID=1302236 RepID=A0ABP8HM32_9SPHI